MMRKLLITVMLCLLTSPVWAADVSSAWIKQLVLDGYEEITISRTWLGRTRIVAEKGKIEREIILNRRTGEVLRDYTRLEDGTVGLPLGFQVELGDDHDDGPDTGQNDENERESEEDDHEEDDHEDSADSEDDSEDGGGDDENDEQDERDDD